MMTLISLAVLDFWDGHGKKRQPTVNEYDDPKQGRDPAAAAESRQRKTHQRLKSLAEEQHRNGKDQRDPEFPPKEVLVTGMVGVGGAGIGWLRWTCSMRVHRAMILPASGCAFCGRDLATCMGMGLAWRRCLSGMVMVGMIVPARMCLTRLVRLVLRVHDSAP
jgi:hypothetical protein